MARVELTEAADRDLTDIYLYSHREFGELQADRYLSSLEECFARLAERPRLGRSIASMRLGYFRFEHASHTVFYTIIPDGIRVVRILHKRMDPDRHL